MFRRHNTYKRGHLLASPFSPKQEPTAILQQHAQTIDIVGRHVVDANFVAMQDRVIGRDFEFGQLAKEGSRLYIQYVKAIRSALSSTHLATKFAHLEILPLLEIAKVVFEL